MRSMTGYGQASRRRKGQAIQVEVRAVNQRFLEVRVNMPREYLPWEAELRAIVQEDVHRGKVDVSVSRAGNAPSRVRVEPNVDLARAYASAWKKLQRALDLPVAIDPALLQARNDLVRVVEERNDPRGEIDLVQAALRAALTSFNRERSREGRVLLRDMTARIGVLQRLCQRLHKRVAQLKPQIAARLRERVAALLSGATLDEERLAQEVALLAERADVTEELVRLGSHFQGLTRLLRGRPPAGKKIDFLLQEVHREANTVASKSADLTVTNLTLEARAEIEKLREQAQNLE